MSESIDRQILPPDNPEAEKVREQKESERYLKIARENPHTLTEEIRKNPKTEPLLRKLLWDTEYERIRDLNPIKLSEDTWVAKMQKEIYAYVDIHPETDRNGTKEKFIKGIIDSIVIENSELAMKIVETRWAILKDMIAQIFSWEWLKQIAEWLQTSILWVFSGDAYKTGKSLWELGLITVWSGAWGFVLKRAWKWANQTGERMAINAGRNTTISQWLQMSGRATESVGKVVQAHYNAVEAVVKKAWWALNDGARTAGSAIWNIPQVQRALEPARRLVSEWMERLSDGSQKVVAATKERIKEVLALASVPILVGSKDGVETSSRLKGQIWAIGDISGKEVKPKEPSAWVRESVDALEKPKTLYDHPDYAFLAWDEYKWLRELFPNLSEKDIIWEGQNGIILKHPDESKVIKIAKPKGDNLEKEFIHQRWFIDALKDLKNQLKWTPDYEIVKRFQIPEIEKLRWADWIYIMERVYWVNFKTFATIKHHQEALKDLPSNWHHWMTDNGIDDVLRSRWLKTYSKNTAEDTQMWWNTDDRHFLIDLESEWTKLMRNEGVEKVKNLLLQNGYIHWDYHWWNAMITPEWKIYLIDFWRSRIPPEITPNP